MKTKEEISIQKKIYYNLNKADILNKRKEYAKNNKQILKIKSKKYYELHKDEIAAEGVEYYKKNRSRIIARSIKYEKNRMDTDINFRLKKRMKARLKLALICNYKAGMAVKMLGCSIENFRQYLEKKFLEGMSWENYGKWHIDHIIPCSFFDLTKPENQEKCFHYTNQQPLWAIDNLKKGATMS
jgi:hypothetical protein